MLSEFYFPDVIRTDLIRRDNINALCVKRATTDNKFELLNALN